MKLLTLNTSILAVNPVDAGTQWTTPDQIIPKHVAAGAVIVDVPVPDGFTAGGYEYVNGGVVKKPPTAEAIKAEKDAHNAPIHAQLAAADLKIIRALAEGDTARIATHKSAQATLRAGLR